MDASGSNPGDDASPSGRNAGQHARETAWALSIRAIVGVVVIGVGLISILLLPVGNIAKVILELTAIMTMIVIDRKGGPVVDRYLQGARGEEKVAAVIDELADEGWLALHDVSFGRGNIDHILIGPAGLFTIETKSHRGRWQADRIPRRMLNQAYAQRMAIQNVTGLKAEPMLVFSDAYLEGRPITCQRGVRVLPARMLARHLRSRGGSIPVEKVRALHARLAAAVV